MATLRRALRPFSSASLSTTARQSWACSAHRHLLTQRLQRGLASAPKAAKKPYYVTTPIFYVNAAPHVGHFFTMVIADILKRWQILLGNDAKLLTGTDEHGMKIQQAAAAAGMDTQGFCDMNCRTFESLAKAANLDNDHFIRTTDAAHRDAVQYFWEMLNHRGYIYTSKHEGWYSVSDEAFYPQTQVQNSLDPTTGRKRMVSIETGKEVEWASEVNYHFRLSAFKDRLLELYNRPGSFITPSKYATAVIQSVSSGLQDLSISRPAERLSWGIPVPGDSTQTIYVWLDALVNYLTYAGYPFPPGSQNSSIWPADVHVIGKDIVRFHCVYWPAFLMALDLPLPRNVLVHGHWTMNREKMSKSTGNVVNPFFAIDRFGVDGMRFFLAYQGGLSDDADYDNSFIIRDYKKWLQGGIGNLAYRTIGCAKGKLPSYIENATSNSLPAGTAADDEHQAMLIATPLKVAEHMTALNPRAALQEIMTIIEKTNKYFHAAEPWKSASPEWVLYNTAESLRISAILLQPFLPEKSQELLELLRVDMSDPSKRAFSATVYGSDSSYGQGIKKGMLFPPLLTEE
ncbi:methionine--tRNA ligase [Penicillium diatomitis]|uniref:Probable methionine--tRNA ligase, mitochondrial n=1 Tax=Penicillium diatomitis TaxID=2819901 RepID=A0A9W9X1P9_9EURO|nr:methionine--tRNA ligase [Penicillium diatomitis]KAJ5480828.1 methionine--tRNA ligase [Penicillium diatomitis]